MPTTRYHTEPMLYSRLCTINKIQKTKNNHQRNMTQVKLSRNGKLNGSKKKFISRSFRMPIFQLTQDESGSIT